MAMGEGASINTKPVQMPLLERLGVLYFKRLSASVPKVMAIDSVSVLNPEERKQLVGITRGAVARACVAGAVSAILCGVAEMLADQYLAPDPNIQSIVENLSQNARYWGVVGGVTVIAAVAEILFLYWDSLRSVHALARAAGLDLFPRDEEGGGLQEEKRQVAAALARAALELPNPVERTFGVDPHREASKIRLFIASILYKLKVSVSNFLMKTLVRRVLGRALVRTWLPFVAVPITALWNGIVTYIVLKEARIRAMGPSASRELVGAVFSQGIEPSEEAKVMLVRAVASSIVRTEDFHPNLMELLAEVLARVGLNQEQTVQGIDDSKVFLECLPKLSESDQKMALQLLTVAALIDGRFTSAEKQLLSDAYRLCGRKADIAAADRLRKAFVSGDAGLDKLIVALG